MQALGMESGAITDSQITASSEWNSQHGPERARLHTKETSTGTGAWASLTNDLNQWLQVDLNKITPVTHVATQGRNSRSPVQMVTMYKFQFSDDGASFLFYKRQGESSDAVNSNRIRRYSIFFGARRMIPVRRIIRLKKSGSFLCTRAHWQILREMSLYFFYDISFKTYISTKDPAHLSFIHGFNFSNRV